MDLRGDGSATLRLVPFVGVAAVKAASSALGPEDTSSGWEEFGETEPGLWLAIGRDAANFRARL